MSSPIGRWNSISPVSGHSILHRSRWARWSCSRRARERLAQRHQRRVAQEDEPSARPEQACRLGDPAVRIGPDRGAVLRAARGRTTRPGAGRPRRAASTSGNSIPVSACIRRAVASCAGVGSTPMGRAPRLARTPRSTPCRSRARPRPAPPRRRARRARDSGIPQIPSDLVLGPGALRRAVRVLGVRLRPDADVDRDVLGIVRRRAHRRTRARPRPRPSPPSRSRARGCPASTARGRRGSSRARRRPGSSRRSSSGRSRSRPRPRAPARASCPEVMKSTSSRKNGFSRWTA